MFAWEHVAELTFVAVSLLDYDANPVIGKILKKRREIFKIHYWKGSWNKKWIPWLTGGERYVYKLSNGCIYLTAFELDNELKLKLERKGKYENFQRAKVCEGLKQYN